MHTKVFALIACVLLLTAITTIQASPECFDANCKTCTSDGPFSCVECKSNYILTEMNTCAAHNPCDLEHCKECSTFTKGSCYICDEGYAQNALFQGCEKLPECHVEHCQRCTEDNPLKCEKCPDGCNINSDKSICIENKAECKSNNCQTCDFCNKNVCKKCKSGFRVTPRGICISNHADASPAQFITYFVSFALLLMTAAIVMQFV